jgi:hypothetical protein
MIFKNTILSISFISSLFASTNLYIDNNSELFNAIQTLSNNIKKEENKIDPHITEMKIISNQKETLEAKIILQELKLKTKRLKDKLESNVDETISELEPYKDLLKTIIKLELKNVKNTLNELSIYNSDFTFISLNGISYAFIDPTFIEKFKLNSKAILTKVHFQNLNLLKFKEGLASNNKKFISDLIKSYDFSFKISEDKKSKQIEDDDITLNLIIPKFKVGDNIGQLSIKSISKEKIVLGLIN